MKIGITGSFGTLGRKALEVARAIETAGFESLWTGEHIVVPADIADPVRHGVPLPDMYRHLPDQVVSIAMAAAVTDRLKFGTNICIIVQRHPLVLGKEIATLDRMSEGRFILGIGNGWIAEEAPIFGYRFDRKVPLANEYIAAMRTIWREETPQFSGEFVSFPAVHCNPKPWQEGGPPILIGSGDGNTDNSRILRRVARIADGWLPLGLTPAQMREQLGHLRELCAANGRDFAAMDISLIVTAQMLGIDPGASAPSAQASELIAQYESAGVTRLVVCPWTLALDVQTVDRLAHGLGLSGNPVAPSRMR